jgi:glycosyltransferase involved in cell wall biosynthesis
MTICNSRFIQGEVQRCFPGASASWLYYPLELNGQPSGDEAVRDLRCQLETPPDAKVIVQVSRIEAWKGHELHLHALARLKGDLNWRCWMVGGSQRPMEVEYLGRLKRLTAKLGLGERVQFLGERRDVPLLLQAADIHCQPNTGPEPFGITFVEALSAGLPVVTTAMGGALEIVNDRCGRLVATGDVEALAGALGELLADAGLRRRLGEQGPARARELCDTGAQMSRLFQLLSLEAGK